MKKLKLSFQNMEGVEVLSREQLKKVMGGGYGSGGTDYSCSCTLKSSGGASLSVPVSSADSTSSTDCSNACKTYCDNANAIGGDCKSYSSVWTSPSGS